jgi:hypothetical protein
LARKSILSYITFAKSSINGTEDLQAVGDFLQTYWLGHVELGDQLIFGIAEIFQNGYLSQVIAGNRLTTIGGL